MAEKTLQRQAESMNRLTKELLRKLQMRDRSEITCCGVSVSQCYALDALGEFGEMTMVQLARKMFLDKSTMTRVVDGLIQRELAARRFDDADRRVIWIGLTPAGRQLVAEIRTQQIESLRQILERIPAPERQRLIGTLETLSAAVHDWLATCCAPGKIEMQTAKVLTNKMKPTNRKAKRNGLQNLTKV
jgi:DNA-binding MarR family transcriptional regulator